MSHLDKVLDDALLGFDDDDGGFPTSSSTPWGTAAGPTHSEGPSTAAAAPEVASSSSRAGTAADTVSLASSSGVPAAYSSKQMANTSGAPPAAASTPAAAAAVPAPPPPSGSVSQGKASSSLQFDPLKRKKKGKAAAAAGAGAADLGGSSSSRPALTPQVQQLQEDLAKLVNEWSQALHPEAEDAAAAAAGSQQRGTSSVLQALAQQTQRTVEEQSRLRPPPSAAAAAAGGASGASGGGGEQMNMIVDVVMQHLLSKEVLYQPMKEIMEKYPPWLDKQVAAGSSSSLTPDDLERYKHQYACITRLCQAYETEPENTAKIMQLLQEMQACGEPPAEIVEEMSTAIAADMPNLAGASGAAGAGAGDMNFDGLDIGDIDLADLPQDLKNCPVQ